MVTKTPRHKKATGIPQFTTTQTLGFAPVRHCWCGGSIEIALHREAGLTFEERLEDMYARLNRFHEEHTDCTPGGAS